MRQNSCYGRRCQIGDTQRIHTHFLQHQRSKYAFYLGDLENLIPLHSQHQSTFLKLHQHL